MTGAIHLQWVVTPMPNIETARAQMIAQQVRAWDVLDERVLAALSTVHREEFVPEGFRGAAFADAPIPLGHGQIMLPPKMEGRILETLELRADAAVLEIGTGSGFLTACLATLAGNVRSLEIFPDLAALATRNLRNAGLARASVETMDALKLDERDRYDAIVITSSLPIYDARFERALKEGGRLFAITGSAPVMEAILVVCGEGAEFTRTSLFETSVPALVNAPQPHPFVF